jgi:UDP-sugar transporter A1/2/3
MCLCAFFSVALLQNKSNMVAKNTFRGGVSEREFDGGKNKNTAIAAHVHRNFTFTKNFIASALLAFVTSAHGLLTTASLRGKEKYSYNVATVPLLAEGLKLSISFVLLKREMRLMASSSSSSSSESASTKVVMTTQVKTVMLYPIPSLIFLLHQAVSFPALVLLDPTTFLVLGNLKIVITGVLTRIFLKSTSAGWTYKKWIGLILVTVGACTTQVGKSEKTGGKWMLFQRFSAFGYFLGIGDAILSALGGVYVEFVFKKNINDSIHWQNLQMYAFGLLFNSARLTYLDFRKFGGWDDDNDDSSGNEAVYAWPMTVFSGHSFISMCVVANLAFGGLLVSHIIKNVDAIAKVFATACAMFLTPTLSFILFAHVPSPAIFGGVLIASYGMLTYYDLVPIRSSGNLSSSSSSSSNSDSIDSNEKNRTATTPRSRRGVVL